MTEVYIMPHIPRTGGTSLSGYLGDALAEETSEIHYHWDGDDKPYFEKCIPLLENRTATQQRKLKFISGHAVYANHYKRMRIHVDPKVIFTIRHPIKRLLSSFNLRYKRSTMGQHPKLFSLTTPKMNSNVQYVEKVAEDYESLYEFYLDTNLERNFQSKWIINNFMFLDMQQGQFFDRDPNLPISGGIASLDPEEQWLTGNYDIDLYELVQKCLPNIWWLKTTENLRSDTRDLCEYVGAKFYPDVYENSSQGWEYWTYEDVMEHPDTKKIIESESHDMKLYELAKNTSRPF